jgi:hypothetical protein
MGILFVRVMEPSLTWNLQNHGPRLLAPLPPQNSQPGFRLQRLWGHLSTVMISLMVLEGEEASCFNANRGR